MRRPDEEVLMVLPAETETALNAGEPSSDGFRVS